jgi:protease PrsW
MASASFSARYGRRPDGTISREVGVTIVAALVILGGIALWHILDLLRSYATVPGVLGVFGRALVFSTLLSVIPVIILAWLDRRARIPWRLYAGLLIWGGFICIGLSLPLNQRVLQTVDDWVKQNNLIPYAGENRGFIFGAPIAGPLVEETVKTIALLLVFLFFRSQFRSARDGFVMGALIGVGFNWWEAALYVANDFAQWGVHTYGMELGGRYALFGLAGHALYTGIIGMFLAIAARQASRTKAILIGLAGYMLGMLAHLINNGLGLAVVVIMHYRGKAGPDLNAAPEARPFVSEFISMSVRSLLFFLPFVIMIGIMLWKTGTWELKTVREQLADESESIVSTKEWGALSSEGRWRMRRYPWFSRNQSQELVTAQNELAFAKQWAQDHGDDAANAREIADARTRIAELRQG